MPLRNQREISEEGGVNYIYSMKAISIEKKLKKIMSEMKSYSMKIMSKIINGEMKMKQKKTQLKHQWQSIGEEKSSMAVWKRKTKEIIAESNGGANGGEMLAAKIIEAEMSEMKKSNVEEEIISMSKRRNMSIMRNRRNRNISMPKENEMK